MMMMMMMMMMKIDLYSAERRYSATNVFMYSWRRLPSSASIAIYYYYYYYLPGKLLRASVCDGGWKVDGSVPGMQDHCVTEVGSK